MTEKTWLSHVSNEITIGSRNRLCAYLIALEGWRRGLTLTWYSKKVKGNKVHAPGRLFSLSSSKKTHYFYKSKGDLTSNEAQRITGNKHLTKQKLAEAGVPVPKGELFTKSDSNKQIVEYANKLGYPLVLKPRSGYQGIGVFANLQNEEEFTNALIHLRDEMNYSNVIVEQYISGPEYRIFVIGDQVVGAIEKIPPSVVGNGINTIKTLIKNKNREKRKNPHLFRKPIKIDYEVKNCIKEEGYQEESILEKGKRIYLRKKNSLSSGGDPVDATDKISEQTINTSVQALNAIPDLINGGLDVIVDERTNEAYIIEINAIAMIGSHLFPEIGKARDVPAAIIDYYFPESKPDKGKNLNVYYDLKNALVPLINKTATEVEVTPAPNWNNMYSTKYIVEGKVQKVRYRNWIRRRALENNLYGYAQNLNNGKVVVAVAGNKNEVLKFKDTCKQGPKRAKVTNVINKAWNEPVKIAFEIKRTPRRRKRRKVKSKKVKRSLFRRILSRMKRFIQGK